MGVCDISDRGISIVNFINMYLFIGFSPMNVIVSKCFHTKFGGGGGRLGGSFSLVYFCI